jgi:hypothetical protein
VNLRQHGGFFLQIAFFGLRSWQVFAMNFAANARFDQPIPARFLHSPPA